MFGHKSLPSHSLRSLYTVALLLTLPSGLPAFGNDATGKRDVARSCKGQDSLAATIEDDQNNDADFDEETVDPELDQVLSDWEEATANIELLQGTFTLFVYDHVYLVEERSVGKFWFKAPRQGRIDLDAVRLPDPQVRRDKFDAKGNPYVLESGANEQRICTGEEIYFVYEDLKLYDHMIIRPEVRDDIGTAHVFQLLFLPAPLFGISADEIKERYHLEFGRLNRPERSTVERDGQQVDFPRQWHIVLYPQTEADKREWSQLELLFEFGTFRPRAVRVFSPSREKETIYAFDLSRMRVNDDRISCPSPFHFRPPDDFQENGNGQPPWWLPPELRMLVE